MQNAPSALALRELWDCSMKHNLQNSQSTLTANNAMFLEHLFEQYQKNPESFSHDWQRFFAEFEPSNPPQPSWKREGWPPAQNGELTAALTGEWDSFATEMAGKIKARSSAPLGSEADIRMASLDSVRAIMMIRAFRIRGHLYAKLDPLGIAEKQYHPELDPKSYGFSEEDYDRPIFIDNVLGLESSTIREMLSILHRTYCGTFALEFMHISHPEEKSWLQERIEGKDKEISFTPEGKRAILAKLFETEGLEKFLDVKYTGTKRFGLDGGEALVPALEQIIKRGGNLGAREIIIGMPHRGRLNVLCNVMAKPYEALFNEFRGGSENPKNVEGSGDVKYHLGASSDRSFDGNEVHLSLTANPSHLEAVDPVVLGKARAKQDQYGDKELRASVIPLLLHGDAAFAGQGVVAECFGLSGLKGHKTGGTIHFIVNNQIGFTTNPRFSRSSPYPSDLAKMVDTPIFHVNGDDPEAVTHAAKLATEFRQKFFKPVVIDMFCYRRFGHNEGDEPAFTQPLMYKKIKSHPSVTKIYADKLISEGVIEEGQADEMRSAIRGQMDKAFDNAPHYKSERADWLDGKWAGLEKKKEDKFIRGKTSISEAEVKAIGKALCHIPESFAPHKGIERFVENRKKMFAGEALFDWSTAEALAFGSLLLEGHPVRLSGQDVERGTFSQRHSVWIDQQNETRHTALRHIDKKQAHFEVVNSMLSEFAVLGFEYGYSLAEPNALVLWEAQFGDFANGAQVMIDQFIASGEAKWLRMSGLVLLLPHGYEGQGPEHSSARLERFLQLCAEENMVIANCSTPANYFHILRRQLKRNFRKPLILMTPKSLLRHKQCVSPLKDFTNKSSFHRVLVDGEEKELVSDDKIKRVIICSGKVYYDLIKARKEAKIKNVYVLRLEQFYPFPQSALSREVKRFPEAQIFWCQEEPKNMGAWNRMRIYIEAMLKKDTMKHCALSYAGRNASASPATGLMSRYENELQSLLAQALGTGKGE